MPSGRNDKPSAVKRGRRLRSETTLVEKLMWERLCKAQTGFRFRRQFPLGPYVLDFYWPALRLAVEIDGPVHDLKRDRDRERDRHLAARDVAAIHIPSCVVYEQIDKAIEIVIEACRNRLGE